MFDMSADFPTLGGPRPGGGGGGGGGGGLGMGMSGDGDGMGGGSGYAGGMPGGSYQGTLGRAGGGGQQHEFNVMQEDFPTLGGGPGMAQPPASRTDQSGFPQLGGGDGRGANRGQMQQPRGGMGGNAQANARGQFQGMGQQRPGVQHQQVAGQRGQLPQQHHQQHHQHHQQQQQQQQRGGQQQQPGRGVARGPGRGGPAAPLVQAGPDDRYGLLGLLSVIRMTEMDLNTLALGQDLTSLGLNLNSNECLYATFGSPWGDPPPPGREPDYVLPNCYYSQPPKFKPAHLPKFSLKTLFYMFYQMPRVSCVLHYLSVYW
jgi:CCR4-NOT transcription complex subunit 2